MYSAVRIAKTYAWIAATNSSSALMKVTNRKQRIEMNMPLPPALIVSTLSPPTMMSSPTSPLIVESARSAAERLIVSLPAPALSVTAIELFESSA